jgi:FkbM family methyltransferase
MLTRARVGIRSFLKWRGAVGTVSTLQWALIKFSRPSRGRGAEKWHVRPRQAHGELTVRLRGASDLNVFGQIFVSDEFASLRGLKNVSQILDLGANAGYSSAYLLSCFPNSRVIAVEPDEQNVAVSRINLESYGDRVRLLHGAVWSERTKLCFAEERLGGGLEWARQMRDPADGRAGDVEAWDVASLIDMTGTPKIDLLKVDIEGAEVAVFGNNAKSWLPKIRNISIELHGPECEATFFRALSDFNYDLSHSGDLTFCLNLSPKAQHTT